MKRMFPPSGALRSEILERLERGASLEFLPGLRWEIRGGIGPDREADGRSVAAFKGRRVIVEELPGRWVLRKRAPAEPLAPFIDEWGVAR